MFYETVLRTSAVPVTQDIADSMNNAMVHIGCLVVVLLAILFQPLYHKLLLKIDTTLTDGEESDIADDTAIDDEFFDEDRL